MGRSVSVPSGAIATVYIDHQVGEDGWEGFDGLDWEDFTEDVRNVVTERYASFEECDRWLDCEDRAILENGHAYIVLCEYCGLASVSLVPRDDRGYPEDLLHGAWCQQIARNWHAHMVKRYPDRALVKQGTMGNGVGVYERAVPA